MILITLSEYIIPLLFGCCIGALYTVLFLSQHRQIGTVAPSTYKAPALAFFAARLLMLGILCSYLLRRQLIVSILSMIGFISIFWLTLLLLKARSHERI